MEEKIKENFYQKLQIDRKAEFVSKWGVKPAITIENLIDALWLFETGPKAIEFLGRSPQSFNRNIKKLFPNVQLQGGGQTWKHWLISQSDYKRCCTCNNFKLKIDFNKEKSRYDNLSSKCRDCAKDSSAENYKNNQSYFIEYRATHDSEQRARTAKRRAAKLQRTPKWADLKAIQLVYKLCPEGYHVDHIYPLQGEFVSGLHVENNLQYLTEKENLKKGNKMPEFIS
jgi:hypothetical protein